MIRKLILALACALPTAAQAEWQQASSKHFVVYSDDSAANVRAFTERLERFDKAIRVLRVAGEDRRGPSSRVTVFVLDDIAAIQKVAGRRGIAGFYSARASGSVAFTPRASNAALSSRAILFHEYAHHWMLTNWSDAAFPAWFVEGFAEFHATAITKPDGGMIFGAVPTYRRYTVADMNLLPVERLLLPNPGKLDAEQRDALYSRGWLLTHYLTFDPARRGKLGAYIAAINSGKTVGEAQSALGDMSRLDITLNAYLARSRLPSAELRADQLAVGAVTVRTLNPAEAAVMPALIASTRGVNAKQATVVAALARQLAAPYPNDPAAQNELAEAEFDAGNFAAAEAAADRVLAADPKSVHGLIYKAKAQASAAEKDKVKDPARWNAIRRWLIAANKADTEDPYPLVEYYDSFALAGQAPSKSADTGLLYAYALAPYDASLRIKAARVLLRQNKGPDARIALGPVAYNAEAPKSAEIASRALDALAKDGPTAALAILDKESVAAAKDEDG